MKPIAERFGRTAKEYDLDDHVKKISHSVPEADLGNVRIKKHTYYIPRPFRPGKHITKDIADKLPLPNNRVSKWVGLTDFPIGGRKQRFRPPLGYWDGFLASKEFAETGLCDLEVGGPSSLTLVEGAWDTNRSVLEKMCTEPDSSQLRGPRAEELLEYSFPRYQSFGFPTIESHPRKKWIYGLNHNP